MPDYQGIGLGTKFLNVVAQMYSKQNYDFSIKTSAKNLIYALIKSNDWCMISYGKSKCSSVKSSIDYNRKSMRNDCNTASFFYKIQNKESDINA